MSYSTKPITNASAITLVDKNATGLVSAYDFKQGSLADLKGSNNGIQYGSLDFVKDRFGSGVYSSRKACVQFDVDSFTGAYYVSCWARIDSYTASNQILWSLKPLSDSRHFSLAHFNSNQIGLFDYNTTESVILYRADNDWRRYGSWVHVVAGIGGDDIVRLWVDGKPSSNNYTTAVSLDSRSINKLDIMSRRLIASGLISIPLDGVVSNVEIYNRDLTDSEVLAIYNRGKRIKSFFDRGLIASGKDFGAGSFLENSGFEYSGTSGNLKIESEDVNGHESKVLQSGTSITSATHCFLPCSKYGVNPKQAAYGTWQFVLSNTATNTSFYSLVSFVTYSSRNGYAYGARILGTSKDTIQIARYGGTVLASTTITPDTYPVVRICRYYDNSFKWWVNGSYIGTFTDATFTEAPGMWLFAFGTGSKIILQSSNPEYNFWYSPNVIEP